LNQHDERKFGILFLPSDDVIVIDNLKNFEARFLSSLHCLIPTYTRFDFQTQNTRNFEFLRFCTYEQQS